MISLFMLLSHSEVGTVSILFVCLCSKSHKYLLKCNICKHTLLISRQPFANLLDIQSLFPFSLCCLCSTSHKYLLKCRHTLLYKQTAFCKPPWYSNSSLSFSLCCLCPSQASALYVSPSSILKLSILIATSGDPQQASLHDVPDKQLTFRSSTGKFSDAHVVWIDTPNGRETYVRWNWIVV